MANACDLARSKQTQIHPTREASLGTSKVKRACMEHGRRCVSHLPAARGGGGGSCRNRGKAQRGSGGVGSCRRRVRLFVPATLPSLYPPHPQRTFPPVSFPISLFLARASRLANLHQCLAAPRLTTANLHRCLAAPRHASPHHCTAAPLPRRASPHHCTAALHPKCPAESLSLSFFRTFRSQVVKALLQARAAVDHIATSDHGLTPLLSAAWQGHETLVLHLLGAGGPAAVTLLTHTLDDGSTPLMLASEKARARICTISSEWYYG